VVCVRAKQNFFYFYFFLDFLGHHALVPHQNPFGELNQEAHPEGIGSMGPGELFGECELRPPMVLVFKAGVVVVVRTCKW
jgi:hypothetical protein